MFATLVRAEHVVLLRSLSSVPPIRIGHFQISSFFLVFCRLSLFPRASWPYDLCMTKRYLLVLSVTHNPAKSKVFYADAAVAAETVAGLGCTAKPLFVVAGTPIGKPECVPRHAHSCVAAAEACVVKLPPRHAL